MAEGTCSVVEGGSRCEKPVRARGWCAMHYYRWKKHGDPLILLRPRAVADPVAHFWSKVNRNGPVPAHRPDLGPCWPWHGTLHPKGYGYHGWCGTTRRAHGIAFELTLGPVPDGLELDHLCRNRACVNPAHLEPVTHAVNVLRGESANAINARKTHCIRGHAFTPENTRVDKDGRRHCRACRQYRDRLKHLQGVE